MESAIITKKLRIGGMTCVNCQNKIESEFRVTTGVKEVRVSYSAGTAVITYNSDIISLKDITVIIQKLDYVVLTGNGPQKQNLSRVVGFLIIIAALYIFLEWFGILNLLVPSQLAETNMGYGMLFIIGLITSVHCIAMCGGINLSQCIPKSSDNPSESRIAAFIPALLYNLGRVVSYTAIGFILGFVGLLLGGGSDVGLPVMFQGILKLIAGVFMVIMGINMLGLFPWLRKLNLRMPKIFARKTGAEKARSNSTFYVGLLNGLMPCGPLQSMQIIALVSGSPLTGALSMLLFSMGTVPLMLGLGSVVSALGKKYMQKAMSVGAVLIVVLGLAMLSQGWSLSGFAASGAPSSAPTPGGSDAILDSGVQIVNSTLSPNKYPTITVQAGTSVRWIIDAPQGSINGCNNRMFINEYDIEYTFVNGENIIEFTPTKTGAFRYSCWMGMIRATINVVEAGEEIETLPAITEPIPANYTIPADKLAVAELVFENGKDYQTVTIEVTDSGFSPAIAVVQAGLDTQWIINVTSNDSANLTLRVPVYNTMLDLVSGENPIGLTPKESFDFSNGNSKFYGYVKVVDDLGSIDEDAIREEAQNFKTMIWPEDTFQ